MKKGIGLFIFVFMAAMIMSATQPALLFGASTSGGSPWADFIDSSPSYEGTKLSGPLSIYYGYTDTKCGTQNMFNEAYLFFTVRLNKGGVNYIFYGSSEDRTVCTQYVSEAGEEIKTFFDFVVVPGIFTNGFASWKLKSVDNARYEFGAYEGAFVADITVTVK